MDYETKLLLNQLIDAVNNKTVDWWMFVITLINAFVSLLISYLLWNTNKKLGERQNTLMAQQNKIDKFRIYHELHRDLFKLSHLSKLVLPKIYDYATSFGSEFHREQIAEFTKQFENIQEKMCEKEADYILHFGTNNMMTEAVNLIYHVDYILEYVNEKLPKRESVDGIYISPKFFNKEMSDDMYVSEINKIMKDKWLNENLLFFVKIKNDLFVGENNILERVRAAYNAD